MPASTLEVQLTERDLLDAMRDDVAAGLTAPRKTLPPTYFYDARGSQLFEEITQLPEYYPTRAERAILETVAPRIAEAADAATLVELGSGSSVKTRLLLDALRDRGTLHRYVAVDVSAAALEGAMIRLAAEYPRLELAGVVADFDRYLAGTLPRTRGEGPRLVAFLGGTIGNLTLDARHAFLTAVRRGLREGDAFLLGADLVKDPERLVRAYDDAAGVTAAFNRNVLHVLNRSLGADFDPAAFDHVAVWDAEQEWIEMRLRARRPMRVTLAGVNLVVELVDGEDIRTEVSAKFRRSRLTAELAAADLRLDEWWTDPAADFAVCLATPA